MPEKLYDTCAITRSPSGFDTWHCNGWRTGEPVTLENIRENAKLAGYLIYQCGDGDSPAMDIRGYIEGEPDVVFALYDGDSLAYWGAREL